MPEIVNRAPVLTLWPLWWPSTLVIQLNTALTLGRAVAGSAARIKARSIGREEQELTTMPTRRGYAKSL